MVSFADREISPEETHRAHLDVRIRTDLTDTTNLVGIISSIQPTEIYNLAAQSHVKVSFDMAEYTVCLPFVRSSLTESCTDGRLRTG